MDELKYIAFPVGFYEDLTISEMEHKIKLRVKHKIKIIDITVEFETHVGMVIKATFKEVGD